VLERLTEREKQVAAHVAAGLRVAGVAQELGLADNTVRNHLKQVFSKLDVHSQTELVAFVRRHPSVVSPYQLIAGLPIGADRDLLEEMAEVDRATQKRIEECAAADGGLEEMKRILHSVLPLDEARPAAGSESPAGFLVDRSSTSRTCPRPASTSYARPRFSTIL
jgi:DNA-binding CsgD family transcriptional regulator